MECIRESFRYYKKKNPPPMFDAVIDFNNISQDDKEVIKFDLDLVSLPPIKGLHKPDKWKAYQLKSVPGFVFIPNPFLPGYQRYWVQRCLCSYPVKPNKTNLDIHMELNETDSIWQMGQSQRETMNSKENVLTKLRWATLGYHHDWNTQKYSKTDRHDFPDDLSYMAYYVAAALGCTNYQAQAAVVNYYHLDSYICAHNDHSELDKEAPLISFSFGQSAIFLVGGENRDDKAFPMYLRSGDIAVLMGPGRLNYHAVPRIMVDDADYVKKCLQLSSENSDGSGEMTSEEESKDKAANNVESLTRRVNDNIEKNMQAIEKSDWTPFMTYVMNNRINMNVRQVLGEGQDFDD